MYFCASGLLKSVLSKSRHITLHGLWKAVQEELVKIPLPELQKALLSWELQCRKVIQNKRYRTKHLKYKYFMHNSCVSTAKIV